MDRLQVHDGLRRGDTLKRFRSSRPPFRVPAFPPMRATGTESYPRVVNPLPSGMQRRAGLGLQRNIYDPNDRDDKLLLDLKGAMSEAELYWMSLRLTGAKQNKARRGQLRFQPPIGYIWSDAGLQMDPDEAVQQAVGAVFDRYEVEPSAWGVVRWARETGLQFPARRWYAGGSNELYWKPPAINRVHAILHNALYAGVYVYGRRPERKVLVDGQIRVVKDPGTDPDRWLVR